MKVRSAAQAAAPVGVMVAEESHQAQGTGTGVSFSRQLTQLNELGYQRHLDELHERIYVTGQSVAQKANLKEFQHYRTLIARFIYEAVSNAYSFNKSDRFDAKGQHSACALIKKINTKLDDMAQELLNEQSDNLKLMGMAEEIRGMLVDLYM